MVRINRMMGAALVSVALTCSTAVAQAQSPAASGPQRSVGGSPPVSAKSAKARKAMVSPYARAAQVRARAGNPPVGHAPTMVQAMGKPHKPHAGGPTK